MRKRFTGFAGLLLTAFFAVAGGFHHHELPKPAHSHPGFCSQSSASAPAESCAICQASHTSARLAVLLAAPADLGRTAQRIIAVAPAARTLVIGLLGDPRAPPIA